MKIICLLIAMCFAVSGCGSSGVQSGFESDEITSETPVQTMEFDELDVAPESGNSFPKLYVIRKGDTLSQISRRFYGSYVHWPRIVEANPGLKPRELRIGQQIILPRISK